MGSGPIRLAKDAEFRAGIEAEGWTVTDDEIEAVNEHDPEENTSGFFDVMGLAMLTGRGWRGLRQTIPGHRPIPEQRVVLSAVRDLEPYQRERMNRSQLEIVPGEIDPGRFKQAITALSSTVSRAYLHVDLDSIDVHEAHANKYAAPGGPGLQRLLDCIHLTGEHLTIAGAAITAYDPEYDADDRALKAARAVARQIACAVPAQPTPATG